MSDLLPTELQLNIVSPDRLLVRDAVTGVTVPGKGGYIGVLPGHAPLLTELVPGELSYTREGAKHFLCVNWGFAEVLPDRVIVLVQSAERAEEIDVERTRAAQERAQAELAKASAGSEEWQQQRLAVDRAMVRMQAVARLGPR